MTIMHPSRRTKSEQRSRQRKIYLVYQVTRIVDERQEKTVKGEYYKSRVTSTTHISIRVK